MVDETRQGLEEGEEGTFRLGVLFQPNHSMILWLARAVRGVKHFYFGCDNEALRTSPLLKKNAGTEAGGRGNVKGAAGLHNPYPACGSLWYPLVAMTKNEGCMALRMCLIQGECHGEEDEEERNWGGRKRGRRTIGRLLETARHTVTRNLTRSGENNVANCSLSFDTFILTRLDHLTNIR